MAIHLSEQHPEYRGDPYAISFSVTNTGPKPILRQIREAVQIAKIHPTQVMNGRSEYLRPVTQRMTHTDLIADNDNRGPGSR